MESIKHTLFEDPLILYLILGVAQITMIWLWRARRQSDQPGQGKWLLGLIAPVLLAGAVFTVERLVVTDREQIEINMREIGRLIQSGKVEGVVAYLDDRIQVKLPQLGTNTESREVAINVGKQFVAQNPLGKLSFVNAKIEPANRRANVTVATVVEFTGGDMKGQKCGIRWILHWINKDGRWLINEAEAQPVKPSDLGLPSGA